MSTRTPSVERLNGQYVPEELPPRPAKSIQGFNEERVQDPWYWRTLATLAAGLIMIGFLIFPAAFSVGTNEQSDQQKITITVASLVIINAGYILSVALWFLRKNWVYQLDCIFFPCLMCSIFGLINTLIVPTIVLNTNTFTAPALASLIVSVISTVIYGLLSLFTWLRLEKLRKNPPRPQNPSWQTDQELQAMQWKKLVDQPGEHITAAQLQAQHTTYRIDPVLPQQQNRPMASYQGGNAYHGGYGGYNTL